MLSREQMLASFAPQKKPYRPLVGFEYEIFCLSADGNGPLPYEGEVGLLSILRRAAEITGGRVIETPPDPPYQVDLPDKGILSLEPGGQFEFSSAPKATFGEAMEQFRGYIGLLEQLAEELPIRYCFSGTNPVHTVDQIGLVTRKRRYLIMNDYYPRVGTMGRRMMRQSSSIQVSFDYKNRSQGEDLFRTALYIAPFAAALFANSPYIDGKINGYKTYRVPIWANTDPARSGLLPGFTRPDYGFDDYLDHVLRAPMFFVITPQGPKDAGGMTFDQFNREGFHGQQATLDDFVLHNSTIFTDVRLKHTVEVRSVDSLEPALLPSVLAFLCGILFCERARLRARHLLAQFDGAAYAELPDALARRGISGEVAGRSVRQIMLALIDLAALGLPTCFPDGDVAAEFLEPIRRLAEQGKTPADVALERFGDNPRAWLDAGRLFEK